MSDYFDQQHPTWTEWRRDLHRHPELAFEEHRTADFVARRLEDFGLEVNRGLARTGVVGTLRRGTSARRIGLRADMDALPITEENEIGYASSRPGVMHACGHDGHTTMLLAAAQYLAAEGSFDGTVHFIFQPAEENEGGGRVMIEDGLFDAFPCDRVYGLHNFPGFELGTFHMRVGPMMAAYDRFEILVRGRGGHAAMPHLAVDPVVVASTIVTALQSIVSRETDPLKSAVISTTWVRAGDTWNVIPETVMLRGCTRSLDPGVQQNLEDSMARVAEGVARAHGAEVDFEYERGYPATVNEVESLGVASRAAADVVTEDRVDIETPPVMGSEDFAFMLEKRPGAYVFLGAGPGSGVHTPTYDFNDRIIPIGARYWARIVREELPASG